MIRQNRMTCLGHQHRVNKSTLFQKNIGIERIWEVFWNYFFTVPHTEIRQHKTLQYNRWAKVLQHPLILKNGGQSTLFCYTFFSYNLFDQWTSFHQSKREYLFSLQAQTYTHQRIRRLSGGALLCAEQCWHTLAFLSFFDWKHKLSGIVSDTTFCKHTFDSPVGKRSLGISWLLLHQ